MVFPSEYCDIFKNNIFYSTLIAASVSPFKHEFFHCFEYQTIESFHTLERQKKRKSYLKYFYNIQFFIERLTKLINNYIIVIAPSLTMGKTKGIPDALAKVCSNNLLWRELQ